MPIDLAALESGGRYSGDYATDQLLLQKRLARAQRACAIHRRRALIVLEGLTGADLAGVNRALGGQWDAAMVRIWRVDPPTPGDAADHFLRRFWERLPRAGETVVLEGSWYGRVLGERVEGLVTERAWRRAYDEINEFEAQLTSDGMILLKLWVHVTPDVAERRLRALLADPWASAVMAPGTLRAHERRLDYAGPVADLFANTDTRWAPWAAIDGNNRKAARIAALTAVADKLERALPAEPPPPSEAVRRAREAMGLEVG